MERYQVESSAKDAWAGPRLDTPMNEDRNQELRALGFCCLQPAKVRWLDGSEVTVTAHSYWDSKARSDDTPTKMRALRFYEVKRTGHSETEIISELELEKRMGLEQFQRLV